GFADFLSSSGQTYWQILPLNPTGTYLGNSPYTSYSVFAGNALFISPDTLRNFDLLSEQDVQDVPTFPIDHVDYESVVKWKSKILRRAFQRAEFKLRIDSDFHSFCDKAYHSLE